MSILDRVVGFFLESEGANPRPAATPGPRAVAQSGNDDALRQTKLAIQRELIKLSSENAASVQGRVHLLDIEKLAALAEGHRKTFRLAARKVIERTMVKHLGAADHYVMLSDISVLVVFHNKSETQARIRCATIAQEILHRLLGDKADLNLVAVHSAQRADTGEVVLAEVPAAAMIDMLVEQAEVHEIGAPAPTAAPEQSPPGPLEPREHMARTPDLALAGWQPITRTADGRSIGWQGLETDRGAAIDRTGASQQVLEAGLANAINDVLTELDGLESELAAMREQEAEAAVPAPQDTENPKTVDGSASAKSIREAHLPGDLGLQLWFTPFLNVSNWLLGTYALRIGVQLPGQARIVPLSACTTLGEVVKAQIDKLALRRAVCELIDSEVYAKHNLIGVQIHYSTLMRLDERRELLRYCNLLPNKIRNRLIWEIVETPRNSWSNGLLLAAAALRPFGRALLLQSDLAMTSAGDFSQARVHAIGVDLATVAMDEAVMFPKLERFVDKARQRGLKTYLAGCDSRSVALAAIGAGFDYINGASISDQSMTSIAARRYAPVELFQLAKRQD